MTRRRRGRPPDRRVSTFAALNTRLSLRRATRAIISPTVWTVERCCAMPPTDKPKPTPSSTGRHQVENDFHAGFAGDLKSQPVSGEGTGTDRSRIDELRNTRCSMTSGYHRVREAKDRHLFCLDCGDLTTAKADPVASGEGTWTLTPEDRFTKETLTPLERARFAIHAEAPNRDLLQALVGEIDRIVALLAAKDAQLAALRTEREEMLIERGQLGVRHARLVETRDSLESTLADLRRQVEWQPTKDANGDYVCEHGTAMDVHCCNCHRGFIFDKDHQCPPSPEDALHEIGIMAMSAQSNPRARAKVYREALIEICNYALKAQEKS